MTILVITGYHQPRRSAWFTTALMIRYKIDLRKARSWNVDVTTYCALAEQHLLDSYVHYLKPSNVKAPMASSHRSANVEVIAKIEAIFENIADSLINEENPYVPLKDIFIPLRYRKQATSNGDAPNRFDAQPSDDFTNVSFPARGRPKEAWRFSTTHY